MAKQKKSGENIMAKWKGWEHVRIDADTGSFIDPNRNPDHRDIDAIAPMIVSASRSTDIPAFYGDWLLDRV